MAFGTLLGMKRTVALFTVVLGVALVFRLVGGRMPAGGNPLLDPTVTPEHGQLNGVVLERLPAGGYVYLRVRGEHGLPVWLVTLEGAATRAPTVSATLLARASQFHSARLGRDFAPLHFASLSVSAVPPSP